MAKNKQNDQKSLDGLDGLIGRCLAFAYWHGKEPEHGEPFIYSREQNYKNEKLSIYVEMEESSFYSGFSYLQVIYNGETVLDAKRSYIRSDLATYYAARKALRALNNRGTVLEAKIRSGPATYSYDLKVKKYIPGKWERRFSRIGR